MLSLSNAAGEGMPLDLTDSNAMPEAAVARQ